MQILKAIVDTQRTNTTIGYVNTGDVVKLNLQVISNGEIGDNWVNPVIELHGIKSDKKRVRQTDNIQIVDLANHHLEITLHEQFMTCDGLVRLQLVIKDDGGRISSRRISSSVFYLRVTKSLEMGVMESHDYIQVFDDFDTYMELVKEFEAKMKEDITLLEAEIQKASDLSQSISKNEAERQEAFEMNESNREVQFNASQSSQTSTFTTNEAERQKGETQRVTNENARQTAERNREVRMAELETKTSELIEKADEQVLKVDEFINANTKRLLEEDARKDYMGNECRSIRETMNSNVDYAVKTAIGEFNYLDYEGQHITANHSIEGHVKSAILKGNTLVNLSGNDKFLNTGYSTYVDGVYKHLNDVNHYYDSLMINDNTISMFSPNKTYTFIIDSKVLLSEVDGYTNPPRQHGVIIQFEDDTYQTPMTPFQNVGERIEQKIKFTIENKPIKKVSIRTFTASLSKTGKFNGEVYKMVLVEGDYTNVDIPYFEGMQSVRIPVLKTTGKNLFDGKLEKGSIQASTGQNANANTLRSDYIKVKPNTLYIISSDLNYSSLIYTYDESKNFIESLADKKQVSFTTPSNCKYIRFRSNIDEVDLNVKYQMEEGSVITSYEPYKSNILTVDGEYGSVGGIEDIVDLTTGKATIKTKQTMVTSENVKYNWSNDTHTCFYISQNDMIKGYGETVKSNLFPSGGINEVGSKELVTSDGAKNVMFSILNTRLSSTDLTGVIKFLEANELNVRYLLATESIKTVDLSDNVVYSYDEVTHYDGSSEDGSLIPTVAVKVPTDVNAVISSQRATIQEQTEQINTLEKENALLTEQNEKQDVDIALNQDAINFMLFEVMGLSNDDANKLNPMAIYFANQILKGKLTYTQVIGKYPQFKDDIDSCLLAEGRSDLIVKID